MTIAAETVSTSTGRARTATTVVHQRDAAAVGALMLLAFVIRIRDIGTTNLWLDEANSWLLTTYSVGDMLANIRHSPSSPLYFLLLKLWTLPFGDSASALRSFSLAASLLVLPLVYYIGRVTVGRAAALIAVALLAVSPLQLYFAQEARVYMLATLLATLTTAGYLDWRAIAVRELTDGTKRCRLRSTRPLVVYALAAVGSLYTLPLVALLYAVFGVDAVLVMMGRSGVTTAARRAVARPWVIAQLGVAAACLPLLLSVDPGAAANSQAWRGHMGMGGALRDFLEFFMVFLHGLYFYPWHLYPAITDKWGDAVVLRLVVVFPMLILALVTAFAYPQPGAVRGSARVLYCGLLVPLVIGAMVSIWHELSLTRYLLFVSPFLALLLGAGIVQAPRWVGAPVLAVMIWASAYGLIQYPTIKVRDSDFRPLAALIGDSARPGDAIVVQPPEAGVQLAYYLRGKTVAVWGLPAGAAPAGAVVPAPGRRTWLALDYRSKWYGAAVDSLDRAMPGAVARDSGVGLGERRVRVIELRDAGPSSSWFADWPTRQRHLLRSACDPRVNLVPHELGRQSGPLVAHCLYRRRPRHGSALPGRLLRGSGDPLPSRTLDVDAPVDGSRCLGPSAVHADLLDSRERLPLSGFATYIVAGEGDDGRGCGCDGMADVPVGSRLSTRATGVGDSPHVAPAVCVSSCRAKRRRSRCSRSSW